MLYLKGKHAGWLTSIYDKALCAFPCPIQYNLKSAALSCYQKGGTQSAARIALKLYTYNVYLRHHIPIMSICDTVNGLGFADLLLPNGVRQPVYLYQLIAKGDKYWL